MYISIYIYMLFVIYVLVFFKRKIWGHKEPIKLIETNICVHFISVMFNAIQFYLHSHKPQQSPQDAVHAKPQESDDQGRQWERKLLAFCSKSITKM